MSFGDLSKNRELDLAGARNVLKYAWMREVAEADFSWNVFNTCSTLNPHRLEA